jgi:hypothetical protein
MCPQNGRQKPCCLHRWYLEPVRREGMCLGRAVLLYYSLLTFLKKNTNVIELYNLILKEVNDNQKTWYNSGIGTYARPSWKSLKFYKQVLYHKIDLAIAWCVGLSFFKSLLFTSCTSGILNELFWVHTVGCQTIICQAIVSFCLVCHNDMCDMCKYHVLTLADA